MARRSGQMAEIDQYVADTAITQTTTPELINPDAPNEPIGAPVPESAPSSTPGPSELDEQIKQAKLDALREKSDERASIREMELAQLEAARIREEENARERRIAQGIETVQDSLATSREGFRAGAARVGQAIGSVPIPGDLIVPLSVLLIFFFALVQIGGHTRLAWLWLTLTGNASIGGGSAGAGPGGATLPTEPAPAGLPSLPTEPAPTLPKFTGVGQGEAGAGLTPLAGFTPISFGGGILGGLGNLFTGVEEIL